MGLKSVALHGEDSSVTVNAVTEEVLRLREIFTE